MLFIPRKSRVFVVLSVLQFITLCYLIVTFNEPHLIVGDVAKESKGQVPLEQAPRISRSNAEPSKISQQLQNSKSTTKNQQKRFADSHDDDLFMQKMSSRMKERKAILTKACKTLGLDNGEIGRVRLLTASKYKMTYCYIPKAGCSNMKAFLLQINGYNLTGVKSYQIHNELSKKIATFISGSSARAMTAGFINVVLVREPFERLVSSYNNKIRFPYDNDFKTFSKRMRMLYGNSTRRQIKEDTPALFEEFVDYVSNGRNDGNKNGGELHWSKYNSICFPCLINYDVILHIETIHDDIRYLLKLIGFPTDLKFGGGATESGKSKTFENSYVETYFKRLNTTQKQHLYKAYESDFKLFGYENIM